MPPENSDDYVLGRTSEEYQRLRRQSQAWEKAATAILDEAGLVEGMTCLDVGCGPGEVMRLMGNRVGRKGKVTGLDSDGKMGREGLEVLKSLGKSNFEFIEGNVELLQTLVGEKYDVVYSRFLLHHLKDPVSILRKMYDVTKPGGSVVIQDYDFRTWDEYPPSEVDKEIKRVFFALYEKAGKDLHMGIKLPSLFVQAGIGFPDGTRVDGQLNNDPMALAVYQSILPLALKFGITTEEASRAVIQNFPLELEKGIYGLWPLCIGAWKRKALQ
jgi:ubiquinone/menaquinone biosynthesis C-methylase UbiE